MAQPPSGTVTFLFTDIEGSTRLWEEQPDEMRGLVAEHDSRFRAVIEANNGYVVKGRGDGVHAAFGRAADAIAAAEQCQAAIADLPEIKVRMGINTGEVQERDGDYFGPPVNRGARLMDAGHGGQVLIAAVTAELVSGVVMRNLGEHRLRDLGGPVVVWQLGNDDFPPLRTLDQLPGNLPVELTSFVGRGDEVRSVAELVAEHRLVTLTGVGGVGKTRLAIAGRGGASPIASPTACGSSSWRRSTRLRVVGAVAAVLSVEIRPGASLEESLLDAIGTRELLLVLDNCEHVVREVRRVANELLRSARGVSILATSREGLRVDGEQLFTVPSLDDDASVRLFVERARAADSAFAPDATGDRVVADLCERLDGVPLAIELAAARARMFSVTELAQRVEQRFRLLTGGRGDVERHQTLRAAIDWSYDLLEPAERVAPCAAARSSRAAGRSKPWKRSSPTTRRPADLVVDMIASLVDKSLVLADRTHSESRYEMLETIRQYAQERLVESGDAEAVRARVTPAGSPTSRAVRAAACTRPRSFGGTSACDPRSTTCRSRWPGRRAPARPRRRCASAGPSRAARSRRPLLGTAHLAEVALQVDGADSHSAYTRVLAEAGWAALTRGDHDRAFELLNQSVDVQRAGGRVRGGRVHVCAHRSLGRCELGAAAGVRSGRTRARRGLGRPGRGDRLAHHLRVDARDERRIRRCVDPCSARPRRRPALRQPTLEAAALFASAQAEFRRSTRRGNRVAEDGAGSCPPHTTANRRRARSSV